MAKKKKELVVNKMYEWELDVDGESKVWKCFVGLDEVITYEGDQECERFPIENFKQERGTLQINGEAKVYTGRVPFQLENGIPYIKMPTEDGEVKWISSDTSKEERIRFEVRRVKKDAYLTAASGVLMMVISLVIWLVQGTLKDWFILPVFGVFLLATAVMNMTRLKGEVEALGRVFTWKLEE